MTTRLVFELFLLCLSKTHQTAKLRFQTTRVNNT